MCGLAGISSQETLSPYLKHSLRDLSNTFLLSRGPDEQNTVEDQSFILYHSRLTIQGGSQGSQPISLNDGRLMVYNGEIYNIGEMQKLLRSQGLISHKNFSDTEVLKLMIDNDLQDYFEKIHGAYALAILNPSDGSVELRRDPLGLKPLFYGVSGSDFFFSTHSLVVSKLMKASELSPEGLALYLSLGYIPEEFSIFKSVRQVKLGEVVHFFKGSISMKTEIPIYGIIEEFNLEKSLEIFAQVVREHSESSNETPSIFLSDGYDSTAISTQMKTVGPAIFATQPRFSLEGRAEKKRVIRNAAATGRTLSTLPLTDYNDALFNRTIANYTSPQSYSSFRSVANLSILANGAGTKVAITGDGGDEIFGGYSWNSKNGINMPNPFWKKHIGSRDNLLAEISIDASSSPQFEMASNIHPRFTKNEISQISGLSELDIEYILEAHFSASNGAIGENFNSDQIRRLRDIRSFGLGHGAQKVDNMGLGFGVEIRTPMLDRRVISLALGRLALQDRGALINEESKWLQKEIIRRSKGVETGNKKKGFSSKTKANLPFRTRTFQVAKDVGLDTSSILRRKSPLQDARFNAVRTLGEWLLVS